MAEEERTKRRGKRREEGSRRERYEEKEINELRSLSHKPKATP